MSKTSYFADLDSVQALDLGLLNQDQIEHYNGVPMVGEIETQSVFMGFRSPYDAMHPNRPYLHLMGYLNNLTGQLPHGLTQLIPAQKPYADLIYEFSNEELANLVTKGLYERDFKVPDKLTHAKLKVPVSCDFSLVKPDNKQENKALIVFGRMHDLNDLEISSQNTDYIFANDFAKADSLLPHKQQEKQDELANDVPEFDGLTVDQAEIDQNNILQMPMTDEKVKVPEAVDSASLDLTNAMSVPDDEPEASENEENESVAQETDDKQSEKSTETLDPEVAKMLRKAAKHMDKRKKELHDEAVRDAIDDSESKQDKKQIEKTADPVQEAADNYRISRQNEWANEQADAAKEGIIQESVPDTPDDFDAIDDDNLDKKQSNHDKAEALKKAERKGEDKQGANKKAVAKFEKSQKGQKGHKEIQAMHSPKDRQVEKNNELSV